MRNDDKILKLSART